MQSTNVLIKVIIGIAVSNATRKAIKGLAAIIKKVMNIRKLRPAFLRKT